MYARIGELFYKISLVKITCPEATMYISMAGSLQGGSDWSVLLSYSVRVHSDRLGGVVCLVDTHQPIGKLEHVVTKTDDDELGIFSPLLGTKKKNGGRASTVYNCTGLLSLP